MINCQIFADSSSEEEEDDGVDDEGSGLINERIKEYPSTAGYPVDIQRSHHCDRGVCLNFNLKSIILVLYVSRTVSAYHVALNASSKLQAPTGPTQPLDAVN